MKIANCNEFFNKGEVIGIGMINYPANSKMECFATLNGQLLGKIIEKILDYIKILINLFRKGCNANKFSTLELYASLNLNPGNSIRTNFKSEEWHFREFGKVLE